jgi:hypothetical protein
MSQFNDDLVIAIPVSGTLAVANGALFYTVPVNADLVRVDVQVGTAPTGASAVFKVAQNGVDGVVATVAATTKSVSVLQAANANQGVNYIYPKAPASPPLASFAAGDTVSVDITQVGSTVAGSNAVVTLLFETR